MIRFEQVSIRVGDRHILRDSTFVIRDGEKVAIRGRSGSGKSTILKSMVGAVRTTGGTITVNGLPVCPENIMAIRTRIAYVGQEPVLAGESVADDLLLPFTFKAHRQSGPSAEAVRAGLDRLCLEPAIMARKSSSLSGGEKQRIVIARAMLMGKKIFLADEITSALDSESKAPVFELLLEEVGHTVVCVSHDPEMIRRCNRVLVLENGILREEAHGDH
ncbi:ABC transporter ATP-binding protein [Thiovibrio sp. JS02]